MQGYKKLKLIKNLSLLLQFFNIYNENNSCQTIDEQFSSIETETKDAAIIAENNLQELLFLNSLITDQIKNLQDFSCDTASGNDQNSEMITICPFNKVTSAMDVPYWIQNIMTNNPKLIIFRDKKTQAHYFTATESINNDTTNSTPINSLRFIKLNPKSSVYWHKKTSDNKYELWHFNKFGRPEKYSAPIYSYDELQSLTLQEAIFSDINPNQHCQELSNIRK
jgi:hypothetical protein